MIAPAANRLLSNLTVVRTILGKEELKQTFQHCIPFLPIVCNVGLHRMLAR